MCRKYTCEDKWGMCIMNDNMLKNDAMVEFKKLIQNAQNLDKDLDCYTQLMKELLIRTFCEN
jgi:hypothetical protein